MCLFDSVQYNCMNGFTCTAKPSVRTCSCRQPVTISGMSSTVTPFSIFISWSNPAAPDCNQCVYEYLVRYTYDNTSKRMTTNETQFVLTDLQPGTLVVFTVWPKCGDVLGNPGMAIKSTSKYQHIRHIHVCHACTCQLRSVMIAIKV